MVKKIFIEVPSWLGDAIMATPSVLNIIKTYPNASITILGSYVSTKVFNGFRNVERVMVDESKKTSNRFLNLYKIAKSVGKVDLAISFRRSFSSKFMMFFIDSKQKFNYKRGSEEPRHLVLRYNDFINKTLHVQEDASGLKLFYEKQKYPRATLGINAGATYGSAKRWYPEEFAKVAIALSDRFDIVIFGGAGEVEISKDIENILIESGVKNYQNLAGKTSVEELISKIAGLDLFVTNDSGPMHIAAAYGVRTIAIFGPRSEERRVGKEC